VTLNKNIKRLAVISDFHGNYTSLKAVIAAAERSDCDYYLCGGDYLGYYYEASEVIEIVGALPHTAIQGNHDRDFLTLLDGEWRMTAEYRSKYGSSLEMALTGIEKEKIQWLRSLPVMQEISINNRRLLLCHGSPWDMDEYLYPDMTERNLRAVYDLNCDLVIMGHTHYQYVKERGQQIVLNPGSVGQARDKGGVAAWAMVTIESNNIVTELVRTNYEIDKVVLQVRAFDPGVEYLYQVLQRGTHGP
jgi:putative phosphoesterase